MAGITWLHLSDWHQGSEAFVKYQKSEAFDRELLSKRLKQDILNRTRISTDLAKIDFFVFSGDVAFSGQKVEYQAAIEQLFTPVLEAAGLDKNRLYIVPGNHDLDHRKFPYLPADLTHPFSSDAEVNQWLKEESDRKYVLIPFEAFDQFINRYTGQNHPTYASILKLDIDGKKVALLGLNSALMCGRNKIQKDGKEEVDDYGKLVVGEPQLDDGLEQIDEADVRIAVLHHPFEWLMHNERSRTEEQLGEKFHFILCGHEHFPKVNKIEGTTGDCFIIPAGAGFDRRVQEDPIYTNAYNFVHLNFDNGQCTVYLRRWNNRNRVWDKDTSKYSTGQVSFILPKLLGHPLPKEEDLASPLPNANEPRNILPPSRREEEGPASTLPNVTAAQTSGSLPERANKVLVILLTYQERSNLTDDLLKVYPNQEEFEIMFERRFGKKLNSLVDGSNYWTRIYHLIERSEAENWTYYLILNAHEERPLNPTLESWLQKYATKKVTPAAQQDIPIPPRIDEPPQKFQTITAEKERQQPPPAHDEQPLAEARKSLWEAYDAVNASKVIFAGRGDIKQSHYTQAITALGQVLSSVQNLQSLSQTFSPAVRERLIMNLRRISTEVTESMKKIADYSTLHTNQRESERKDTASRLSSIVKSLDNLEGI